MRKSFSMIELILAIVIMSLSLLAIPTIIFQTMQSNAHALQQEAILQAKMQMGIVFSTPWDSSSYDGNSANNRILRTDSTTSGLSLEKNLFDDNDTLKDEIFLKNKTDYNEKQKKQQNQLRKNVPLERWVYYEKLSPLSNKDRNQEGLNDYDGYNREFSPKLVSENGNLDLLLKTKVKFNVSYISDNSSENNYVDKENLKFVFSDKGSKTPTSNIKMIEISANVDNGDGIKDEADIVLRAYSSNILQPVFYTKNLAGN